MEVREALARAEKKRVVTAKAGPSLDEETMIVLAHEVKHLRTVVDQLVAGVQNALDAYNMQTFDVNRNHVEVLEKESS